MPESPPSRRETPRRRRRFRRRSVAVALIALLALLLVPVLLLYLPAPGHQPLTDLDAIDRHAVAAEDQLLLLRNWAASVAAREARAARGIDSPRTPVGDPAETFTLTLRDVELTALALKWARLHDYEAVYLRYLRDPVLGFASGRLLLSGRGPAGIPLRLKLGVEAAEGGPGRPSLHAGRIPLPASWLDPLRARLAGQLADRSAPWRRDARLDPRGLGNSALSLAVAANFAGAALRGESLPRTLLVPIDDRRALPVDILGLQLRDGQLTVTFAPVPKDRRNLPDLLPGTAPPGNGPPSSGTPNSGPPGPGHRTGH